MRVIKKKVNVPKAILKTRITFTLKSISEWKEYERVLDKDELVFDENGHYKIGDGKNTWNKLPYAKSLDKYIAKFDPINEDLNLGTTWLNEETKEVFILVCKEPIEWKKISNDSVSKDYFIEKLNDKVSFETGKRLSSNDYTDEDKKLVHNIPNLLTPEEIPSLLKNKIDSELVYTKTEVNDQLKDKANTNDVYTKSEFDKQTSNTLDKTSVYEKSEFDAYLTALLEKKADLVNGVIPSYQIPSTIDNIQEFDKFELFPHTGVGNKLYVDISTSKLYRWNGVYYVEVSPTIKVGKTELNAYPGSEGVLLEQKYDKISTKLDELETKFSGDLIKLDSISTEYIADEGVHTQDIDTVETLNFADGSVNNKQLAMGSITTDKIQDNSISDEKILNVDITKLKYDKQIIFIQ